MINKILVSYLFVSLLLAMSLALLGVDNIQLGSYLQSFIVNTSREMATYRLEIPEIPTIEVIDFLPLQDVDFWQAVLNFLINFGNVIVRFINGVIQILNFIVMILNFLIQALEFIFLLIKNFFIMRDSIVDA